jgi:outer membrane protein
MYRLQPTLAIICIALLISPLGFSQISSRPQPEMPPYERPDTGFLNRITKTYKPTTVPPINLSNSGRLDSLLRAGNIYLSVQDAVALALENNIDIEVQRYGALIQDANILRAQAGGALRGVTPGVTNGATSAQSVQNTVGITQSAAAAASAAASNSQGALVQQTGSTIQNFDPALTGTLQFGHFTTPQNISVVSGITGLVNSQDTGQFTLTQAFPTGTSYSFGYSQIRQSVNSPTYTYNPYLTGSLSFTATQRLLQGFGRAVNTRNIVIAKNTREQADLNFRQQVISTVSSVVNLYWDLVSFIDNVKSQQEALAYNQRLYSDNKKQVEIGTLAPISIVQAEAAVATSQQNVIVAETQVLEQETIIKDALSRNGIQSPSLINAHVIPTDRIRIPDVEPVQPYQDAVAMALSARPEIAQQRIAIENNRVNSRGSKAELLPTLNAFVTLNNNGLAGSPNTVLNQLGQSSLLGGATNSYFVGGQGVLLSQVFGRNFPDYAIGLNLNIPIRNRTAQADYILDQLTIRQSELALAKQEKQIRVDVQNAMIGVQQARSGYFAAVKARILQEQTLDAEQKKLALGASTIFNVILIQRDLATAQSAEVSALGTYAKSKVQMDTATGQTLDTYGVKIEEAFRGQVSRGPSPMPPEMPPANQPPANPPNQQP